MEKISDNNKWKNLVQKQVSTNRRKCAKRREWKTFNDLEIDLLFDLGNNSISNEFIEEKYDMKDIIKNGSKSFILQCISVSLKNGKENLEDKFFPFFENIDKVISKSKVKDKTLTRKIIYETTLLDLVENEDSDSLKNVLDKLHGHHNILKDNNIVLIAACKKNLQELVLPLISAGYR